MLLGSLLLLCSGLTPALAQITVYGQTAFGQTASPTSSGPVPTTLAAYNTTELVPPPVPNPPPANAYTLNLQRDAAAVPGLSIPHVGPGFWGFSIEMSVISQVLGKNSSHLQVPFLNLMANMVERTGSVLIRLGGNTQEFATMVPSLPDGKTFSKEDSGSTQTTRTPAVIYTKDMFYMMSNISALVNVKWFLGIPFNDSVNWRLAIAEEGQEIVGENLLGLQAGNEPDFYETFGRRTAPYTPQMYVDEVQDLINTMDSNPRIVNKHNLIGPSVATGPWTPEQVLEQTNFLELFRDRLYCLTVEHYPNNNCAAQFDTGNPHANPQQLFPDYLTHNAAVNLVNPYRNTGMIAQRVNKPLIMFETNTASCGGFPGISDSFGAALWAIDYGMQMAYANFTHGMLHVGGQNVFYNPFTSPPTNQSTFNQWSVGAVYYSALVLAEAFGRTNTSRIIDLGGNQGSIYTPSYAIYENNVLHKIALFNFIDDQTPASESQVTINVPTGAPASVRVKYLAAPSVSNRNNITWAGQTFGAMLTVDGRLRGEMQVQTINCVQGANTCTIPVPAPGFALVFIGDDDNVDLGQATRTYSTSAHTKTRNTATVDPALLATSNGHSGMSRDGFGSTSAGSVQSAGHSLRTMVPSMLALSSIVVTGWVFGRNWIR